MVEHLKLKAHKGIKAAFLLGLRHINVLCGRNNSGKTALLEAAQDPKKRAFGKLINKETIQELNESFRVIASGTTHPGPSITQPWFEEFSKSQMGQVVFEDEIGSWTIKTRESFSGNGNLSRFGNVFNFEPIFQNFVSSVVGNFRPIFIPSNRDLAIVQSVTALGASTGPYQTEQLKTLYRLKNAGRGSKEFERYQLIENAFVEVSGGCQFEPFLNPNHDIKVKFSEDGKNWFLAEDSGFGFGHLVVILCSISDPAANVVMIEEPEIHIHPEIQRRLLGFIDTQKDKQFFISTHSNVFLDPAYVDKVFFTKFEEGEIRAKDQTRKVEMLSDLGYSAIDNLVFSDAVIITEGPSDISLLRILIEKLGILKGRVIKFWPLGGDIMAQIDLSTLIEGKKAYALVDNDPGSKRVRDQFMKNCEKFGIQCTRLERYAIENYLSLDAIKATYPHQNFPAGIAKLEPDKSVELQLGFSIKGMAKDIVQKMDAKEFEGTDLLKFLLNVECSFLPPESKPRAESLPAMAT